MCKSQDDRFKSIDILRFVLALCVIAIHCGLQDICNNIYNLFQMAVPCFFVISGYMVDRKSKSGDWGGVSKDIYEEDIPNVHCLVNYIYTINDKRLYG